MTTAIVIATKYGATAEIAERLAGEIPGGARVMDLADGEPDLADHPTVVLGTAIYAGKPLPAMRRFASSLDVTGRRIGLFVGGMEPDPLKRDLELAAAYPEELRRHAIAMAFLGGRFQLAKMRPIERAAIWVIAKVTSDVDGIDQAAIEAFAATLARPQDG